MNIIERTVGKRSSGANKVLSILVAAILVLSMPNLAAFAEGVTGDKEQIPASAQSSNLEKKDAVVADAIISLKATNAHVVVDGVAITTDTLSVSTTEDFVFTLSADTGFAISDVSALNTATDKKVTVKDSSGTYTIAAKDITTALKISVTALALPSPEPAAKTIQAPQLQSDIVPADAPQTFTLEVEYLYPTGDHALNTYSAEYVSGETFQALVPQLAGYDATCVGYTIQYDPIIGYFITGTITQDTNIKVTYTPQAVTYKVTHKFEQLNGTYLDEIDTVPSTVGQWTSAEPKVRAGYTSTIPSNVILVDNTTDIVITYTLNTYKLSYNSNAGSYVSPSYAKYGATTTVTSTVPTKNGYTFAGWFKDVALTQAAGASVVITADTTLYAKWTPQQVTYTVVFWKQKVTDSKTAPNASKTYDYAESAVGRTATVGASVTPTAADQSKSYTGFNYNGAKSVAVTVAADGTSVLNVYYDRALMTLNFYTKTGNNWNINQTFTGLYGSTLAQNSYTWPTGYSWNNQQNGGGTTTTFLDAFIFPSGGTTFNLYGQGIQTGATIRHYKQDVGTSNYTLANTVQASGNATFNFTNKYTGFSVAQYRTSSNGTSWSSWTNCSPGTSVSNYTYLEIRHTRNTYNLAYYNYNTVSNTLTVPYQSLLGSYASYTPPHPAGLPSYYAFVGWYKDPSLTTLFNFATETMPLSGVTVYAKWAAPIYNVSFDTVGGTPVSPQTITAGQSALAPADPIKNGYEFQGWYTDTSYATPYDFNAPITQSKVIYAKWKQITSTTYTIKYMKDGGSLFPDETHVGTVGTSVNAVAKQHPTFIPDATTKTLASLSYNASSNVITFNYSEPHNVYYKVQYINYATGEMIEESDPISTAVNQVVVYSHDITGYEVTAAWQQKALADEPTPASISSNIITFYCKPVITVTAISTSKTYDGAPLSAGVTTSGNLAPNDTVNAATSGSITNVGSVANTVGSVVILHNGTTDVTNKYIIHKVNGTLTVNPVPLTITAASDTKAYDGAALTNNTYSLTSGAFVGAQGFASVTVVGTQTIPGSSANTITGYTFSAGTLASNYVVTTAAGTLTVTDNTTAVTITSDSDTWTYDGATHDKQTATATGLPAGFSVEVTSNATITNAGNTPNTIATYTIYNAAHQDVTAYFQNVTTVAGTLTVTPVALTITAASDTKAYDGAALTNNTYSLTSGAFVGAQGFASVTVTGTQTIPGSSANTITGYTFSAGTLASNYAVTSVAGTLTVTNNTTAVTITADSDTWTYDGATHDKQTATATGLPAGFSVEVTSNATITNAGNTPNTIATYTIYNAAHQDVTAYFQNVTTVAGTLTVTPVALTITAASDTKAYDGAALTNNTYSLTSGAFVGAQGFASVTVVGTQTIPGSSANTITGYTFAAGTLASNYVVTTAAGTLTVTDNTTAVTITSDSDTWTYDGATHDKQTATATGLPAGFSVEVTSNATITNAGNTPNTIATYTIYNAAHQDVTAYFQNVTTVAGTLTVNPASLYVITGSATKVYDTTPLTANVAQIVGLVNQESASVAATGTITDVGTTPNTYMITWDGTAQQSNYIVNTEANQLGTLEVTPGQMVVTSSDYYGFYDALPHGITVNAPAGSSVTYDKSNAYSDVTPSAITVNYTVTMPNYNPYYGSQTVTVVPLPLAVTANNLSKVIGAADPAFTYVSSSATAGQTPAFAGALGRVAGEGVGTYAINQGTLVLTDSGSFKASNYELVFTPGTLAIVAAIIPPVTPDAPIIVAPVADVIADVVITEDETPLAAPKSIECWVHWWILLGLFVTIVYAIAVIVRRRKYTSDLQGWEDQVLSGRNPKNPQSPTPIGSAVREG